MDIDGIETCCLSIVGKEMLDHAFLHGALSSDEEIGRDIPTYSQVRTQKFCRMSPQRFLLLLNPTATLLEHALLAQGFMGTSKAAFPRRWRPQSRDSTWENLLNTPK